MRTGDVRRENATGLTFSEGEKFRLSTISFNKTLAQKLINVTSVLSPCKILKFKQSDKEFLQGMNITFEKGREDYSPMCRG